MNSMMRVLAGLMLSSAVLAAPPSKLTYNYLQGQFMEAEVDGSTIDVDGPAAAFSFKVNDEVFVGAEHAYLNDRNFAMERLAAYGAYRMQMSGTLDLNFGAGLVDYNLDFADDDAGVLMFARMRGYIDPNFEIAAGFQYEDALEEGWTVQVYGAYHFHKQMSIGLQLDNGDIDRHSVVLRFMF